MLHYLYKGAYDDGCIIPPPAASCSPVNQARFTTPALTRPSTPATTTSSSSTPPLSTVSPFAAPSSVLLSNALVYVLAEKYNIPTLKRLAAQKYEKVLPQEWDNVSSSLIKSLSLMYSQTAASDRMLKDIAVGFAHSKAKDLAEKEEFVRLPVFCGGGCAVY
jgi:hypothetical protein